MACEGRLIFLTRKPTERVGENPLFPPSLSIDFYSEIISRLCIQFVHLECVMLQAHPQMRNS